MRVYCALNATDVAGVARESRMNSQYSEYEARRRRIRARPRPGRLTRGEGNPMAQEIISVGVHLTPDTEIVAADYVSEGVHVAVIRIGEIDLYVNSRTYGDAGIIAVAGAIRDAADDLIRTARERYRIASGIPALPDALEPASLTDATEGWEIVGWADSWAAEIAARPPFLLPDVPLAAISETELRALDGDR